MDHLFLEITLVLALATALGIASSTPSSPGGATPTRSGVSVWPAE